MDKLLNIHELAPKGMIVAFTAILSQFDDTNSFMFALFLGFFFNIIAGMKADHVQIKIFRVCNFNGNKLKDSLAELFLIVVTTYFLKIIADLMGRQDKSVFIVEWLVWVALYYYVRNGLKNLQIAYPRNKWIGFVYNFLSFQFFNFAPESIKNALNKEDDKNK